MKWYFILSLIPYLAYIVFKAKKYKHIEMKKYTGIPIGAYIAPNNIDTYELYKTCRENLEKTRKLGFNGMHYIDVLGTVPPRDCFSGEHPITKKQGGEYFFKTMQILPDF